jgi:hypothetical protein
MSILSKIFDKIFRRSDAAQTPAGTTTTADGVAAEKAPSSSGATATAQAPVDVEAVLTAMDEKNPQKLNWRTSIVDLMKLVGMDSTLQERKQLADELGYTGDKSDTAAMNIWLHKQVMAKIAQNGGKVPAELLD